MAIIKKILLQSLLLAVLLCAAAANSLAQEGASTPTPSPTSDVATALYIYKVAHDHRIGKGDGELRITEAGIEYRGASADEERHSRVWRDEDIKRLEISKTEIRLTAYEAARIPLIPRKVPYSKGGKDVRVGSEREHIFRLTEGEITPEVVQTLLARFKRPLATSVIPNGDMESGNLLFEIPVFHRRRAGGESGVLRVYEEHVLFASETNDSSRYWRYADIRDIGRLGRYQFEVATYERQFAADGKSYIFDLKRPMTNSEYEMFWTKVYESGQSPRLRPAVTRKERP